MDAQRLELKVGLFLALGLAALAFIAVALGGQSWLSTRYDSYFIELKQVQGLFSGSTVSLAGVPVGRVGKIRFADSGRVRLELRIDSRWSDRLRKGTQAEARTQGALGDRYVFLTPSPLTEAEPIPPGSELPVDETDFLELLTSRESGAARAIDLIKDAQLLIQSLQQQGKVAATTAQLGAAARQLETTLADLSPLIRDLRKQLGSDLPEDRQLRASLVSLNRILDRVDRGQGTLGQLINDPSVHQSLKALLGQTARNRYIRDVIRETVERTEPAGTNRGVGP